MGGSAFDQGLSIATDSAGNVYTTGVFGGTADFDPGDGTFNLTSAGFADIFISKLNSDGSFAWAKKLGGSSDDIGYSIAVDSGGNVYTTGYFQGTADFDPGAGTFNLTSAGSDEIFISKLNSDGTFAWAKKLGGSSDDIGNSIAVDSGGNVYTTGYFQGTVDFDPGAGTANLTSAGSYDIFISKLSPTNSAPTNLTLSATTVNENVAANTVVGTFTTTDPDAGNTFTYSLVAGTGATDNSAFTINGNQLQINASPDFETKSSYNIRVQTADQGGLSFEKELTININDVNELNGNNTRDPLTGTAGIDYITGGAGAKTLTGGAGNDYFIYNSLRDVGHTITDFTVGSDKLVFTQLLTSIGYNGTNPIADGYVRFIQGSTANSTVLQIDRDGLSGSAVFRNFITFDNITPTQLNNVNNFVF